MSRSRDVTITVVEKVTVPVPPGADRDTVRDQAWDAAYAQRPWLVLPPGSTQEWDATAS